MDPVPPTAYGSGLMTGTHVDFAATHGLYGSGSYHSFAQLEQEAHGFEGRGALSHSELGHAAKKDPLADKDTDFESHEHFRVVIRVRPPLDRELVSPGFRNVVAVTDDTQVCLHEMLPEANAGDRASGTAQVVNNHAFTFDHVYDRDSSQPSVYSHTARASVLSTLQGYNATILAYGPTGTGKTYTMEGMRGGQGEACGIIPRSMEEIFQHIRHCRGPQSRFLVRASYLQIYNEVISDLLKPDRTHLLIREDRKRGVFVDGLSEWLCRSPSEVRVLMEHGSAARATAQTAANDASSRSHAVFIVIIEQSDMLSAAMQAAKRGEGESERAAGPTDTADVAGSMSTQRRVRVGRLNLVDLAGSERPRITGATGQRLEETKKINQSLSALGNVIAALTERRARAHIPYRDSKLTRLLQDSLGGNCRTTMMAMVSPAAEAFAESLSTLQFAHRAKAIQNCAHVNEDVDQRTLLRRYEAELRRLRTELRERSRAGIDKRQLHELEEGRRRAEEDRLAAVSALQERSAVLEQEKKAKQLLEERIRQMSSQLLVGGQQVENTPQFRHAVAEQERIRVEYATKLSELEKERSTIEEDKAQVGRYKQLLLKQRDIMIALTQRLHERDEAIIALQDDIDARDRRNAELEEEIERKGAQLFAMERRTSLLGSSSDGLQQQSDSGGGSHNSFGASLKMSRNVEADWQYPPENAVFDLHNENPMKLLSANEKVHELSMLLDNQRQENHRLTLELEELHAGCLSRSISEWMPSSHCQADKSDMASVESRSLPPALASGLLDRISDGLLEVSGPTLAKLRLTQDVLALKRLLNPNAEQQVPARVEQWGTTPPISTPSTCYGGSIGGMTTASVAASAAAASSDTQGSETSSMHAAVAQHGFGHLAASAGPSIGIERDASTHAPSLGHMISSARNLGGSATPTPEGSHCGSSPRVSSAAQALGMATTTHGVEQLTSQRAMSLARGELRGRRTPSLERGRGDVRPRSSSRGDKHMSVRPSSASEVRGAVGGASLKSNAKLSASSASSVVRGSLQSHSDNLTNSMVGTSGSMSSQIGANVPAAAASSPLHDFLRMGGTAGLGTLGTSSASAPSTPNRYAHPSPAPPAGSGLRDSFGVPGSAPHHLGGSNARDSAVAWLASLNLSSNAGTGHAAPGGSNSHTAESDPRSACLRRSSSVGRSGVGSFGGHVDSCGRAFSSLTGFSGQGPVRVPPHLPTHASKGEEALPHDHGHLPSSGLGARFPPATAAALASSGLASSNDAHTGGPARSSMAADALREEAQKAVDALLARRKAELRRSPSPTGPR